MKPSAELNWKLSFHSVWPNSWPGDVVFNLFVCIFVCLNCLFLEEEQMICMVLVFSSAHDLCPTFMDLEEEQVICTALVYSSVHDFCAALVDFEVEQKICVASVKSHVNDLCATLVDCFAICYVQWIMHRPFAKQEGAHVFRLHCLIFDFRLPV